MTSRGHRIAFVLWLLTLAACILVIASTRFISDLSAFMPQTPNERQQLLVSQFKDGIIGRLIMIGIEGGDAAQRADLSRALADGLRGSGLFTGVQNGDAATDERDHDYFFGNRYLLSPNDTADRFSVKGLHAAIGDSIDALSGDAGLLIKHLFPRDPTGETLQLIDAIDAGGRPRTLHGAWASRDGTRAVLLAYTRAPGTDVEAQAGAITRIRQTFAQLPGLRPDNQVLMSGTGVFSVKSRNTIEGQVTRLASASLLLVVCLLLLVYRSPRLLLFGLLPVLSGVLVGITAVSLSFGRVHGLTLGFGTTLIGEAVDYSIYFFLQRAGRTRLDDFWRTIWLGVATSIAGFAALLFSGFPGLEQLGVYTISGLVAAALVTRYVLPAVVPRQFQLRDLDRFGRMIEGLLDRAYPLRWLPLLLAVAAVGVVYAHAGRIWNRNLSSLSPISTADQQLDLALRNDLGAPDLRYMVAFSAPDQEQALQGAERTGVVLRMLMARKLIAGFNTPAAVLPSQSLQRARQAAIPGAAQLRQNLEQALIGLPVGVDKLQGFLVDTAAARARAPLTRADLDGTSAALLLDSLLVRRSDDYLVLMPLRAPASDAESPLDIEPVQSALQTTGLRKIVVIDLLEESTRLFDNYRDEVLALSEVGSAVIFLLLFVALKSVGRTLRVVAPLIAAVACDTAFILLSGTPLTILHLVGLLLVIAIGSNYALFLERGDRADDPGDRRQTQVSLVVANLTTVGSFGILGVSSVPVLSGVGATVSLGAFLSLVFSALLSRRRPVVPPDANPVRTSDSTRTSAWRPTPFILASLGIHAVALLWVLLQPSRWPWALAAVVFNHALISLAGLWPRSRLLGANQVRLTADATRRREVALTFDDGPDPAVTPQVLDILDRHRARATFFCIGTRAAAHPDLCRDIVARGHRVENHGQRHPVLASLSGVGGWMREVGEGLTTLERLTGRRPRFFRAMAGLRNPFLDPVLWRLDLRLVTWTRRAYDTRCGDADTVFRRLTRDLDAGDILLLHDGHSARNAQGRPVVLEVLPRLLNELAARDLHPVPLD